MKNSFDLTKIICEQDAGLFMASLDADSLFTNILLDETINSYVNELSKSNSSIQDLEKTNHQDAFFNYQGINYFFYMVFYTQVDNEGMGSPLEPSLANAFLCHHEKMVEWLSQKI